METEPLLKFTSHIMGKNANVRIYPDRIEWDRAGRVTATRMMAMGTMGGFRKGGSTEMILMKSITSVTTKKDGLRNYAVSIIVPGNTLDMRVSKDEAEQIKRTILAHMG